MTMLKERYIAAALERVPDDQRADVAREIRAAIDEMVDQRIEAGEPEDAATERALNELGDPAKLAASYQDRPRYFIGPGWYPSYISVLKKIPAVVLPIVAIVTLLVGIGIDQKDLSDAIQGMVESVIVAAIQIVFWVTLGFAIAERVVGPEMPSNQTGPWTIADLPEASAKRQITLGSVLPDIIVMIVVAVLVAAQTRDIAGLGVTFRQESGNLERMPLLNPAIGGGWIAAFFVLILFSILSPIVRYSTGFWTRPAFLLEIVVAGLWSAFIIVLAIRAPIINPAVQRIGEGDSWSRVDDWANATIMLTIIAISVWAAWEAWQGYREYRQLYEAPATGGGSMSAARGH